jgi:hypothetical protein
MNARSGECAPHSIDEKEIKKEKLTGKQTVALVMAGVSLAAGALSLEGCGKKVEAKKETPIEKPAKTPETNIDDPIEYYQPNEYLYYSPDYDYSRPPEHSVVKAWGYEKLTDEQKEFIDKCDDMTPDEFYGDTLTDEERQMFATFVVDNFEPRVVNSLEGIAKNYPQKAKGYAYRYIREPKTPEEYLQTTSFMYALLARLVYNDENGHVLGGQSYDVDTAMKIGPAFWSGIKKDSQQFVNWEGVVFDEMNLTEAEYIATPHFLYTVEDSVITPDGEVAIYAS